MCSGVQVSTRTADGQRQSGSEAGCTVDLSCDLCWCADDEDVECPPELLVPKGIMADLCGESAKLKSMNVMNQVSSIFRFS